MFLIILHVKRARTPPVSGHVECKRASLKLSLILGRAISVWVRLCRHMLRMHGSHSVSSAHTASYASSNLSLAPSSITSYGTPEHSSPSVTSGGVSAGPGSRHNSQSSYSASAGRDSLAPQQSVASAQTASQCSTSSVQQKEAIPANTGRDGGIVAAPIHVCDCCPKKPKKFNTLEELQ